MTGLEARGRLNVRESSSVGGGWSRSAEARGEAENRSRTGRRGVSGRRGAAWSRGGVVAASALEGGLRGAGAGRDREDLGGEAACATDLRDSASRIFFLLINTKLLSFDV